MCGNCAHRLTVRINLLIICGAIIIRPASGLTQPCALCEDETILTCRCSRRSVVAPPPTPPRSTLSSCPDPPPQSLAFPLPPPPAHVPTDALPAPSRPSPHDFPPLLLASLLMASLSVRLRQRVPIRGLARRPPAPQQPSALPVLPLRRADFGHPIHRPAPLQPPHMDVPHSPVRHPGHCHPGPAASPPPRRARPRHPRASTLEPYSGHQPIAAPAQLC